MKTILPFLAAILLVPPSGASPLTPTLEMGFANPPPECRPEVFWDWMGGMISKDGITRDLESLAAQGVGGAMIMQMPDQCPYPRQWSFRDYPGKVTCLSDEYFAMMHHAVAEADRLGLNLSLFMSPGWSHCGGPWVPPEKGLKKLAATRTSITGPTNFNGIIDRPPVSIGRAGGNEIPSWNRDAARLPQPRENFYRDEAVLAVPDLGGRKVPPLSDIVDLTGRLDVQGRLTWEVPVGKWTVWRLALISENGINHPAPVDGVGLECDRMDPAAVQAVFDGLVGRIQREAKAKGYHSLKCFETDSYEAGYQDYGLDFRAQFKQRRGYDCVPWLPAWLDRRLSIQSADLSQRFRADMLRTISELWRERFHGTLRSLADENGMEWMIEPYWGVNLDWRMIGGVSPKPGAEFWVGKEGLIGSTPEIAALYGQKVVWAEAFTAESYQSAWRNDPWMLKPWGDAAFCLGINHFFMHGFVHNPFPEEYQPGLSMGYWGTQLSRHVTWWPFSRSWHEYLARCQYLLRQGMPATDVLIYPPRIQPAPVPLEGPYRQVVLTDEVLMKTLAVRAGRLVLPHGTEFAALALAPDQPLRPEALRQLLNLVKAGATLIGNAPPPHSASLENHPACDRQVTDLIREIWGENGRGAPAEKMIGQGRVLSGYTLTNALARIMGPPDFLCDPLPETSQPVTVRSAHRRVGNAHVFFVSHQGDAERLVKASFRVNGFSPEWWNPVDGSCRDFPDFTIEGSRTVLPLRLAPRQSGFVVFQRKNALPTGHNQKAASNFPGLKPVMEIPGSWEVSFDPRWGGPAKILFDKLADWSQRPEHGIKYYSGQAAYRKVFDLPGKTENGRQPRFLDLGLVRNLARVCLNGQELGTVWCAPWRVEVPAGLVKEKGNALEIQVVNTWGNRLIGDEQEPEDCELEPGNQTGNRKGSYDIDVPSRGLKDLPDWLVNRQPRPSSRRYTFTSWRFYDRNAPLQSAGLLGPVTIQEPLNP